MIIYLASTAYNGSVVTRNIFAADSIEKLFEMVKENTFEEDNKFEWYWEVESMCINYAINRPENVPENYYALYEEKRKEIKHKLIGYIDKRGNKLTEEPDYLQ